MQAAQVYLQDFKFHPAELTINLNQTLNIKIKVNNNSSRIYSLSERFFVITVEPIESNQNNDQESDPLYENQSYDFKFEQSGLYLIKCSNYNTSKCRLKVVGEQQPPIIQQFDEIWEPVINPKNKRAGLKVYENNQILSPRQRSFKFSEQEISIFVDTCEIHQSQHSDEENIYLDGLYRQEKLISKVIEEEAYIDGVVQNNEDFNQNKARSEQRFKLGAEEDEDDNLDCMSCYHGYSGQDQKKRYKFSKRNLMRNPILALSNTDSLSTYNTYSQHHLHLQNLNKIETQSTFSELCDQQPFTSHHEEKLLLEQQQQQKVGRKNSDPLREYVKNEQLGNALKKYRFPKPTESIQIEQNSIVDIKSSESEKELEREVEQESQHLNVFQKFFKELVNKISEQNSIFTYDGKITQQLHENAVIIQEYLDQDFMLALDFDQSSI